VPVYELVGRTGASVDPRFPEALALYRKREFAAAREAFAALDGDPVAAIMTKRCAILASAPRDDDGEEWDGVYEQKSK
jgi:hypothetical protein